MKFKKSKTSKKSSRVKLQIEPLDYNWKKNKKKEKKKKKKNEILTQSWRKMILTTRNYISRLTR